ncbi:MAG TPA: hypothetical protein VF862_07225, partial [Gemmatimonadales bacterium]
IAGVVMTSIEAEGRAGRRADGRTGGRADGQQVASLWERSLDTATAAFGEVFGLEPVMWSALEADRYLQRPSDSAVKSEK